MLCVLLRNVCAFKTTKFAKIGLASETTIMVRLINLFGTIGHAGRLGR